MNDNVENVIKQQKIAFEEVLYSITDPSLTPNERFKTIQEKKQRFKDLLMEVIKYYKIIPDNDENKEKRDKLKDFINEYKDKFNNAIDEHQNLSLRETTSEEKSRVLSAATSAKNKYCNMSVNEYNDFKESTKINISLGTKLVDGEEIENTNTDELYYVISPYTEDSLVIVTRFVNPNKLTEFVHDNFRRDAVQPIILYGKQAKLDYNISIKI
jgi:hypothetical protein